MRISIRTTILCPVLLATCLSSLSVVEADDLFSEIAMESVFRVENDASAVSAEVAIDERQRVTGAGSLANVLEKSGFTSKKVDQRTVSVTIRQAGRSLPLLMSVAVDQDRLDIVMLLSEIQENGEWDTSRLTELFAANAEESTVFFAFSQSRKRIELRRTMSNRSLTPTQLKAEILKMAMVAETYEDAWSNVVNSSAEPTENATQSDSPIETGTTPSQPSTVVNKSATSNGMTLVGRWSATMPGGDALAVQIAKEGKFQMVIVKAGKSTVSNGTASRSGDQLTFAESNGTKIVGTFRQTTTDAFSLILGGNSSATLNFKRAK